MNKLEPIKTIPKTGNEFLSDNGLKTNYRLLDFWRWSVSDILSNATRGKFAEFIVGSSLGLNSSHIRSEWDACDLITESGIKIEVKSSAYIQSWSQKKFSTISFSIKPSKYWNAETNTFGDTAKRHADLYVFCHLKHKDQNTINPLKMEQWDFYVLPTYRLDNYKRSQSSITINSLRKLTGMTAYSELKNAVLRVHKEQQANR